MLLCRGVQKLHRSHPHRLLPDLRTARRDPLHILRQNGIQELSEGFDRSFADDRFHRTVGVDQICFRRGSHNADDRQPDQPVDKGQKPLPDRADHLCDRARAGVLHLFFHCQGDPRHGTALDRELRSERPHDGADIYLRGRLHQRAVLDLSRPSYRALNDRYGVLQMGEEEPAAVCGKLPAGDRLSRAGNRHRLLIYPLKYGDLYGKTYRIHPDSQRTLQILRRRQQPRLRAGSPEL